MPENKWTTDVDGFKEAVANDEYAELELPTGDVLITDWEGDGYYLPYVQPKHGHGEHDTQEQHEQIAMAIEEKLDVEVTHIEWSPNNGVYYPDMDRPQ